MMGWLSTKREFVAPCTVEIERSDRGLHAHVDVEGFFARPGDRVQVHDVPNEDAFGDSIHCQRRATVIRAGWFERTLTRWRSLFELFELFEVGFDDTRRKP